MRPHHFCRPPLAMQIERAWFNPEVGRVVRTVRGPLSMPEKAALAAHMDRDLPSFERSHIGGLTYTPMSSSEAGSRFGGGQ